MAQYLIDFIDDATEDMIKTYLTKYSCTVVSAFDQLGKVYLVEADKKPRSTSITESIILDADNPIELLDYSGTFDMSDAPKREFDTTNHDNWWKVASLKTPEEDGTEDHRLYGRGTDVYIVDSGIAIDHPEFENADVTRLYSFIEDQEDHNGHGTALASVISGKTCGLTIAPIKALKVFDPSTKTLQSHLVAAFDAIASNVQSSGRPGVVNLSWSIPKNEYIESKIKALFELGILVVAASGNDGRAIADVTPASLDIVATIGSYDENLMPCDFSGYTGETDISNTEGETNHGALDGWAPGVDIRIAKPDGTYGYAAGTSMSAAIHSGAFAYNIERILAGVDKMAPDRLLVRASLVSLGREGILNLSDEKYKSSVNRISTYYSNPHDMPYSDSFMFFSHVGDEIWVKVFDPTTYVSATTDFDLPAGTTIDNGVLHGTLGPIGDDDYRYRQGTLTLTDTKGAVTKVAVYVLEQREGFDYAATYRDGGGDPEMPVTLLYCNNGSSIGQICCPTGPGGCTNWYCEGYCDNTKGQGCLCQY